MKIILLILCIHRIYAQSCSMCKPDYCVSEDEIKVGTSQTSSQVINVGWCPTTPTTIAPSPSCSRVKLLGNYHNMRAAGCAGPSGTVEADMLCNTGYTTSNIATSGGPPGYATSTGFWYPKTPGQYLVIASGLGCRISGEPFALVRIVAAIGGAATERALALTAACSGVAGTWQSVFTHVILTFPVGNNANYYIFMTGFNLFNTGDDYNHNRLTITRVG